MIKRIISYLRNNQVDCFTLSHNTKKLAFTLAETLIVMGIIGVVAALTLPNLNSSTGDKEKVAKVKKIYSNLQDALGRAEAVYGPISEWSNGGNIMKRVPERLTEFMKISKDCGTNCSGCFNYGYAFADDRSDTTVAGLYGDGTYCYILADGTAINIDGDVQINVDIDGPNKGARTCGVDFFVFLLPGATGLSGVIPDGTVLHLNGVDYNGCNTPGSDGDGAACWVTQNGNMDYLKCPEKLSNNVTSCK